MSQSFENRIHETLCELARSCRSLAKRSSTIADLAGEDASLGVYSFQSRHFANLLEQALTSVESLVETRDERTGLGPSPLAFEGLDLKDTSGNMMNGAKLPSPEGTISKPSSLRGTTSFLSMPDLIGFIGSLGANGMLEVTTFDETFSIVFQDGRLTHAASDNAPEGARLGDILVEQETLTQMRLTSFLLRNKDSKVKLGEALMIEEQVTEAELFAALEEQVRRLFLRLFDADGAIFEFNDGACPKEAIAVKMAVPGLLLESMVTMDHNQRSA